MSDDGIVARRRRDRPLLRGATRRPTTASTTTTEWGCPVADDTRLFEKLCLEGFQSGLSWLTILRKREAFRAAFAGFDFHQVARFDGRGRRAPAQDDAASSATAARSRRRSTTPSARSSSSSEQARSPTSCGVRADAHGGESAASIDDAESRAAGPQAARLALRRPDHRVRVHAGDGPGQRPPDGCDARVHRGQATQAFQAALARPVPELRWSDDVGRHSPTATGLHRAGRVVAARCRCSRTRSRPGLPRVSSTGSRPAFSPRTALARARS